MSKLSFFLIFLFLFSSQISVVSSTVFADSDFCRTDDSKDSNHCDLYCVSENSKDKSLIQVNFLNFPSENFNFFDQYKNKIFYIEIEPKFNSPPKNH